MEPFEDTTVSNQQVSSEFGIDALVLSGFMMERPYKQAVRAKAYVYIAMGPVACPNKSGSNNQSNTNPSSSRVSLNMAAVGTIARTNKISSNNQTNTNPS